MRMRLLIVPLVLAAAIGGYLSLASPTADQAGRQVLTMDGYPLDRTLAGLASWRDLDAVVVVRDVTVGTARWTTADGAEPAYITEGRAPSMAEGAQNYHVVTGFTGTVEQTLLGTAPSQVTGAVVGGSIGNVDFVGSDEIAPALSELHGRLLLAGKYHDGVLQPAFVYRVSDDGAAVSLLASGSDAKAEFSLAALRAALLAR